MTHTDNPKPIHQGRNVKRFRELANLKQEALADMLGAEWSQKKVSIVEAKEVIEDSMIEELSKALNVPTTAIKSMSDDSVLQLINNTFHDQSNLNSTHFLNYQCTISNPYEEVKRLSLEKDELYKALLKEKDEKIALLQKLFDGTK